MLESALARGKGRQDGWDLFPLAMCQYRLGDRKAARDSFDKAVAWGKSQSTSSLGDSHQLAEPLPAK